LLAGARKKSKKIFFGVRFLFSDNIGNFLIVKNKKYKEIQIIEYLSIVIVLLVFLVAIISAGQPHLKTWAWGIGLRKSIISDLVSITRLQ